jgi:hypothetical protein
VAAAIALALAVSTKVFLWPMFVWSLATRRTRLAVLASGAGLAITAALWFVVGFDGLVDYPERLRDISASESIRRDSLSFVGLATTLGLGVVVGHAMMLVAGISLLFGSVVRGRRGDDREAFCLALAAAVAMTPILWLHYLLLLMVPLAITRPRFTPLWLLPLVLWMDPEPMHPEGPLASLPMLVVGLIVALVVSDGWHVRWHRPLWLNRTPKMPDVQPSRHYAGAPKGTVPTSSASDFSRKERVGSSTSVMSSRTSSSGIRRPARYTEAKVPPE